MLDFGSHFVNLLVIKVTRLYRIIVKIAKIIIEANIKSICTLPLA